ncbi:MAG: hypothetical protein AMJ37_04815 [Dehalococcoidia bacterium DG_18]|nr:MAG: hypothetical protein AMJ37_04815 [Dehalococcoidia bacterium DG_18]
MVTHNTAAPERPTTPHIAHGAGIRFSLRGIMPEKRKVTMVKDQTGVLRRYRGNSWKVFEKVEKLEKGGE